MNYNQFKNISCYEEFEIKSSLTGISKLDVLKEIGHQINNYYFFISNDGIFNWFDSYGNHVEDPCVLKELHEKYIPKTITKCIIPNSVSIIGIDAFSSCDSLKEVTIPDSITNISIGTFSYCKSLKEITIPNSVTSIGDSAFYGCESLESITIPNNVTYIGELSFSYCRSLKKIIVPNSVKSIGNGAFYSCKSLEKIIIPNSVESIGRDAFSFCDSLEEVNFNEKTSQDVKQMRNYPFGIKFI